MKPKPNSKIEKLHKFFIKRFISKSKSWLKSRSNLNQSSLLNEQDNGAACEGEAQALMLYWSDNGCSEGAGIDWSESTDGMSSTITPFEEFCAYDSSNPIEIYYDGYGYWPVSQELYDFATFLGDGTNICNCVGLDEFDCGVIYGCTDSNAVNYNSEATQSDLIEGTESSYNEQCIVNDVNICTCQYQPGCTNEDAENYDPNAIEDDGSCIIYGCTDEIAENYNPEATEDDGTCEYIEGCTDETAFNYEPLATYDDGSCIPIFEGCTDPEAVNHAEGANTDDGSCYYNPGCTDPLYVEYNPTADFDDGSCDTPIIEGCMDPMYVEYDENANIPNQAECITLIILGCTDENFLEYNEEANTDDGSCETEIIEGCIDETMYNYNPEATVDDGSCIAIVEGCTDPNYLEYVEEANTDDGSCQELIVEGCTDETMFNYNPEANIDNDSCEPIIEGCTDSNAFNYNENANIDDNSCYYEPGCTDPAYLEYEDYYDFDDGSCATLIIEGCSDPNYLEYNEEVNVDNGSCQELIVEGCTDNTAFNYDSSANVDDGSCIETVEGCMDETADNFNQFANVDDPNDCIYLGCTNSAAENYNFQANTDDGSCIILGCTTPQYNEYNPEATEDDGSCETLGLTFLEGTYEYITSQTTLDLTITSPNLNNYDSDSDGNLNSNATTDSTVIEIQLNNETSGTIQIYQILDNAYGMEQPPCNYNSLTTEQTYDFSIGSIQAPEEFNITINGGLYTLIVISNGFELTPAEGQSPYSQGGMFKGRYNFTNVMVSNIPECVKPGDDIEDSDLPPNPISPNCSSWQAYFSQFAGGTWYTGTELGDDNLGNYQQAKYCKLCAKIAQGLIPPETIANAGFNSEYFSIEYCNCCDDQYGTQGDFDPPKPIPTNESLINRLQKLANINGRRKK